MSDTVSTVTVPKYTGGHGDVFAAVGLADLLQEAFPDDVGLADVGHGFAVRLPAPMTEHAWERIAPVPGYLYLRPNEKAVVPDGVPQFFDYPAEREKAQRLREQAAQRKGKRLESLPVEEPAETLHEQWRLMQVLNLLQGDETANKVHRQISGMDAASFRQQVAQGLAALGQGKPSGLDWAASAVQLFTPNAAKGYSRLKPDSTSRGDSTKEQWVDPFVEWLRYRGYFKVACPYFQGPKGEHVHLLCPVPADIGIRSLCTVVGSFRARVKAWGAAPKLDVLAVLGLVEMLVRHSQEYGQAGGETEALKDILSFFGRTPAQLIGGVATTHYQSLGQSKAVTAMSVLALPGWFPIASPADALTWLEVLSEHQRVIRAIDDEHSDEIGLLITYRRFLQTRGVEALDELLAFMAVYGSLWLRAHGLNIGGRPRRLPRFTQTLVRRVIMGIAPKYELLLGNPGFQAVARAIRLSTVGAQALKAAGVKDYREIRYDLLPDMNRKRNLPGNGPLIEALSEFIRRYNYENERRRELGKRAPARVSTEEFGALVALVDEYGAPVVGALLCAYGTCKEPRAEEPEVPVLTEENEEA